MVRTSSLSQPFPFDELTDFECVQSGKVKSDVLRKPSVADEVNIKFRGKKGGKKTTKSGDASGEGVTGGSGRREGPEDAAEESSAPSSLLSLSLSLKIPKLIFMGGCF